MLNHDSATIDRYWHPFSTLSDQLRDNDDIALWRLAIGTIAFDAQYLIENTTKKKFTFLIEFGRCSHWLRPHQYQWTKGGGFAVPIGYGATGFSLSGLPEFDWSLQWQWQTDSNSWQQVDKPMGKRRLKLRVALPARSHRHPRAAIHTIWLPGSPTSSRKKVTQFYGFRKQEGNWNMTAYRGPSNALYGKEDIG